MANKFKERGYPYGLVAEPGSAVKKKTGEWAVFQPEFHPKKCLYVKAGGNPEKPVCLLCYLSCPDNTILVKKGKLEIDYEHCKGCLICINVCPTKALTKGPSKMRKEEV